MAPELRIAPTIAQTLKLKLTPELRQAIEVLALSRIDLEDRIEKEVEENPVLEQDFEPLQEDPWLSRMREGADFGARATDPDLPPVWERHPQAHEPTLVEHLQWQIDTAPWPDEDKVAAAALLQVVDVRGYLPAEAPAAFLSSASTHTYDHAAALLQRLEPTGVGARDLAECLTLQLQRHDSLELLAREIVQEHMLLLAQGSVDDLIAATGATQEQLATAIERIRALEPNPGRNFGSDVAAAITPDVVIERTDSGYEVELLRPRKRRPRVNNKYQQMLKAPGLSDEDKQYLRERLRAAEAFVKSLLQRDDTILRVAKVIVRRQQGYLDKGPAYLKPLSLRDVAQETELHESTISRVTSNKYGLTPEGLISLKSFFHQAVGSSDDGDGVVAEAIRLQIEELIANENKAKPLSDQAIANKLADNGVHIARRTVAKYRGIMNIPSKSDRKQVPA